MPVLGGMRTVGSGFSNPGVGGGAGVPSAPANLAVIVTQPDTIDVSWDASVSGAPTSYVLEGGTFTGGTNLFNTDLGLVLTHHEGGVPSNYYYVRVRAKNASGVSAPSNEVGFGIGGATAPGPPPIYTPPPAPVQGSLATQTVHRRISFQGLMINTGAYGTLPWFPATITSYGPADRASIYSQLLGAGDAWGMATLSWNYAEPGQPYGSGNTVPPRDMTGDLAGFRAIVEEMLSAGFSKVMVMLAGDGEGAGPGYNDPVGWTYGRGWLMANLAAIIGTFQAGTDITGSCIFLPGFDGVMPGWDPAGLDAYLVAIRGLVGSTRCVGLELGGGYSHWGGGPADWLGSGQNIDYVFQEFPGPPVGDPVWQIAARHLGPGYHRDPSQPVTDDPSPPYYLGVGTPRGAYDIVAFEYETFRWVRLAVSAGDVAASRQYLANVGYPLEG